MKKIFCFILFYVLIINFSFSQNYSSNFSMNEDGNYIIDIKINDYELINTNINGIDFKKIIFSSSVKTQEKGWAELPIISTSLQLPNEKNFEIIRIEPIYEEISLDFPLLPSRGIIYRNQDPSEIPYEIATESLINKYYPANIAQIDAPFIIRNIRGISVNFFPFQYNPIAQKLRVYRQIRLVGECNNKTEIINPLLNPNSILNRDEIGMYQSIFINYNAPKQALATDQYGDILVIYTSRDAQTIQPYIQWKREKGYIVYEEMVATGTNVQTLIQQKYNDNPNLYFVQLVGDWADIKSPTINVSGDASPNPDPTDPYMGCVSGSDNFPDIAIGRFSCSNAIELQTQINKAINYEKTPNMDPNWRESFIGIASNEGSGYGDDGEVDYTHIQRIYNQRLQNFTYNTHKQNYAPSASASTLAGYINSGASTIAYCGHGNYDQFVTTAFNNNNVNNLTNGDKLPFIMSVACINGQFHQSGDCFAEYWLKKQNGGAVVTLMSTINQPWTPPQRIQDYFYDILTGGFNYSQYSDQNGINSAEQRSFWGSIVINAFNLGLSESSAADDIETVKTWTTFGDASLQLRTKQPESIMSSTTSIMEGIAFTTTITKGVIPVENAMVCISQNGNYFSGITNTQGQVSIPNTLTSGQALLVVTAFNTTTIYENINVYSPNPPTADFIGQPTTTIEGETVYFNNTSQYGVSFLWNFGDGTTSIEINPTHIYTIAGQYNVSLTVTNSLGNDTEIKTNYITVNPNTNPPTADFFASATTIIVGNTVDFTDLSINNPNSWTWTFQGGTPSSSSQQNPTGITYSTTGTYAVTLTVSNEYGTDSETKTTYINVTPPNYCNAGANSQDEYIGNLIFNTINNTSGEYSPNGYGDFTSISTNVIRGQTYPISVNVPKNYSQDRVYVWIDYNIDGTFDNSVATELVFTQNTTGQSTGQTTNKTYSGSITIPTTATLGATRMRVRLQYNGSTYTPNTTPCGNSGYGEVEDYTIIIENDVINTYDITSSAIGNGTITPSGIINVAEGESLTYNIIPNDCYQIANVLIDGLDMGAITSYTFSNISENHIITAVFEEIFYNVTVQNSNGGSINVANAVQCGSSLIISFIPDSCYTLQSVVINNSTVQFSNNEYKILSVNTDITIQAIFAQITYTISSSTNGNGTINPLGDTTVFCGEEQTYSIIPNVGYSISAVFVNSDNIGAISSYTFQNINSNNTIVAEFEIINSINNLSKNGILIYPNPTNGILTIEGENIERIEIYDITGKLVMTDSYLSNKISLNNLSDGLYNLRIYTISAINNQKIILRK